MLTSENTQSPIIIWDERDYLGILEGKRVYLVPHGKFDLTISSLAIEDMRDHRNQYLEKVQVMVDGQTIFMDFETAPITEYPGDFKTMEGRPWNGYDRNTQALVKRVWSDKLQEILNRHIEVRLHQEANQGAREKQKKERSMYGISEQARITKESWEELRRVRKRGTEKQDSDTLGDPVFYWDNQQNFRIYDGDENTWIGQIWSGYSPEIKKVVLRIWANKLAEVKQYQAKQVQEKLITIREQCQMLGIKPSGPMPVRVPQQVYTTLIDKDIWIEEDATQVHEETESDSESVTLTTTPQHLSNQTPGNLRQELSISNEPADEEDTDLDDKKFAAYVDVTILRSSRLLASIDMEKEENLISRSAARWLLDFEKGEEDGLFEGCQFNKVKVEYKKKTAYLAIKLSYDLPYDVVIRKDWKEFAEGSIARGEFHEETDWLSGDRTTLTAEGRVSSTGVTISPGSLVCLMTVSAGGTSEEDNVHLDTPSNGKTRMNPDVVGKALQAGESNCLEDKNDSKAFLNDAVSPDATGTRHGRGENERGMWQGKYALKEGWDIWLERQYHRIRGEEKGLGIWLDKNQPEMARLLKRQRFISTSSDRRKEVDLLRWAVNDIKLGYDIRLKVEVYLTTFSDMAGSILQRVSALQDKLLEGVYAESELIRGPSEKFRIFRQTGESPAFKDGDMASRNGHVKGNQVERVPGSMNSRKGHM
ncbi:hypothetical protein C8J56DRAFT_879830 [Mycena floridula]|nr:hypothetical protein C8J56DRAFT_879830 [Mycena floridula]